MKKYLLVTEKKWHLSLFENLKKRKSEEWKLIDSKDNFTYKELESFNPNKIFIPHWSYIIDESIFLNFECILFHMTDLPYGRGGSPLQNLIINGHKETQLTAIKVSKEIDTGDIYLKKKLALNGTAKDIFDRSSNIMEIIIHEIIIKNIKPKAQEGIPTYFKRRNREDGNLKSLKKINEIHDYIRMLDCDGYPPAFLETENFTFEFSNSNINNKTIIANVRIFQK